MNTMQFQTPQEIKPRKNISNDKVWLIAIDAGFSSLKGVSPNKYFCFPSFVKKMEGMIEIPDEEDILYSDESGTYLVGRTAQRQVTSDDTSDTDAESFSRNRYASKKFRIILRTGIAIGMLGNQCGEKPADVPIAIQTGLPTAYVLEDSKKIMKALMESCRFKVKVGVGPWQEFSLEIHPDHIYKVMAQPSGTYYSIMIDSSGKYRADAKQLLMKNVLIVDAGFGTFDPYGLMNRKLVLKESLPGFGMKRILEETAKLVFKEYGEEIRIAAMQKHLEKGYFLIFNEEEMKQEKIPIGPYLSEANRKVCLESIEALKNMTNYLRDYDIMVPTGGTCEAWMDIYKDYFKNMKSLEIIPGNRNENLSMFYSNVRGYYMFRNMLL